MSKIYYITHPLAKIEPDKPNTEWSLLEDSEEELERLSVMDFWKDIDLVFSSPEKKALQTAEYIKEHNNINYDVSDDLNEVRRESYQFVELQKYLKQVEDFYLHPEDSCNGWEKAVDAQKRLINFLDKIMVEDKDIAVISHGIIGTLLACYLKKVDPTFNEDPKVSGCMMVVDWKAKNIISEWEKY